MVKNQKNNHLKKSLSSYDIIKKGGYKNGNINNCFFNICFGN